MSRKSLLYSALVVIFLFLIASGGYFLFTQRKDLLFKHVPDIYWKTQKEIKDIELPQISGRVVRKEDGSILVVNTTRGKGVNFLIPAEVQIVRFNSKMEKEEISFEEIKNGEYVLIALSSDNFYEEGKGAGVVLVSSYPIFSKIEKHEAN